MATAKFNVYEMVTNKVIEALEAGVAPWSRSWKLLSSGEHRNAVSGKSYRGLNVLLLNMSAAVSGYADPRWLTYKNAESLGGNVKRGEKGTQIIFWNFLKKEDYVAADGTVKEKGIPFARAYTVFNVAQCEGIDFPKLEELPEPSADEKNSFAEDILNLAVLRHGGNKACYMPVPDVVVLPDRTAFESTDAYYSVGYHEIVHWTGHAKRLDRDLAKRFGSEAYAFEELVAEMGSAFLGAHTQIPFEGMRHPEYIASWLKTLKNDTRAIFTAASKAQGAVDYVLKEAGLIDVDPAADPAAV